MLTGSSAGYMFWVVLVQSEFVSTLCLFPFPTFSSDVEKHLKMQMNACLGTAAERNRPGHLVRMYRQKSSDKQAQRQKSHKDK